MSNLPQAFQAGLISVFFLQIFEFGFFHRGTEGHFFATRSRLASVNVSRILPLASTVGQVDDHREYKEFM